MIDFYPAKVILGDRCNGYPLRKPPSLVVSDRLELRISFQPRATLPLVKSPSVNISQIHCMGMGLANDFIDANLIIHQRTQGTDKPTVEENDAGYAPFAHYQNSTVKKFSQPILKG